YSNRTHRPIRPHCCGVETSAVVHRGRRNPTENIRHETKISTGRVVQSEGLRLLVRGRATLSQPDTGPHIREYLRPRRTLHRRKGPGTEQWLLVRRPDGAGGASAVQR